MYAQQLSVCGSYLVGERTKVLENDLDWEALFIEGMWVTMQNIKYYFFMQPTIFLLINMELV